jgi:superfamily II DNA or RNA helicase
MSPTEPQQLDFHQGTLRLRGLTAAAIDLLTNEVPLVDDSRQRCWVCDAMHAATVCRLLGVPPTAIDSAMNTEAVSRTLEVATRRLPTLRDDQIHALDAFENGGRRGLVVMPTGTGKTVVALSLIARQATSTLIVVPVRDLMYQWHTRISETLGIDAGLIGDGVHRVSPISVTTYDSAAIHMPRIGDRFDMIVFDEVHHLAGPWRSDAARMSMASARLGLTATPPTAPDRVALLHELVGPTLYRQAIEQASGKTLAEYTVRRIPVRMDDTETNAYRNYGKTIQQFVACCREENPDFQWDDTYKIVADAKSKPELAMAAGAALRAFRAKRKIEEQTQAKFRVLEDLFRLHAGTPVIVFTGSNVMARRIAVRFMVPCLLSHCAKRERKDLIAGFAEGRYPVLVANRVLDEGVDLPAVKTAIVLGGMASTRQAIQRLGRVLRRSPTGEAAQLYEIVTEDSNEVQRSRDRRRNTAYQLKTRRSLFDNDQGGAT